MRPDVVIEARGTQDVVAAQRSGGGEGIRAWRRGARVNARRGAVEGMQKIAHLWSLEVSLGKA